MYSKNEYKKWTISDYRKHLQATAPEGENETFTGKTVRFWSIYLTKLLSYTNLTPNWITTISVFVFFSGMSLFAFGDYSLNILGAILVYLSVIFDACDGEIARLKGNKGGAGAVYTEPVSHDIQYSFMFIPLTYGVYIVNGDVSIVYIGFLGTIFKLLTRFLGLRIKKIKIALSERNQKEKKAGKEMALPSEKHGNTSLGRKVYRFFNRQIWSSVGMPFPLLLFSVMDRVDVFIYFYTFGFFVIFMLHFVDQIRFISSLSK